MELQEKKDEDQKSELIDVTKENFDVIDLDEENSKSRRFWKIIKSDEGGQEKAIQVCTIFIFTFFGYSCVPNCRSRFCGK